VDDTGLQIAEDTNSTFHVVNVADEESKQDHSLLLQKNTSADKLLILSSSMQV
jgi:hypothetical protein